MNTFSYRQHLYRKLQHGGLLRLLLDALNRLGINITPYYLLLEDCTARIDHRSDERFHIKHLQDADMPQLAALPVRPRGYPELIDLLARGKRCVALMDNEKVAAFSWYDLDTCNYAGYPFALKHDEAYLFDAYTLADYRGQGLAPYLRSVLYRELANMGRSKLYSVSTYFNRPAMRFKEKLGARREHLGLSILLLKRYPFHWVLKRYPAPALKTVTSDQIVPNDPQR